MSRRDAITADIIDMYDAAIRAADTKAQIVLIFATLMLTPAASVASFLELPVRLFYFMACTYGVTAAFFLAAVFPRTSIAGGTNGLFSEDFHHLRHIALDPATVQKEMLAQKHDIYFAKLRFIRFGIWACVVQVIIFCAFVILEGIGEGSAQ